MHVDNLHMHAYRACSEEVTMASPGGSPDRHTPSHYSLSSDDYDDDWELPSVIIGGPQKATADPSITSAESDDAEEAIVAHVLAKSAEEKLKVPERFVLCSYTIAVLLPSVIIKHFYVCMYMFSIRLQDILMRLSQGVDFFVEYILEVRRSHILTDCLRGVSRHDFSPSKHIKVHIENFGSVI